MFKKNIKTLFCTILLSFVTFNLAAKDIDLVQDEFGYKTCNYHEFNFMFFKVYDSYLCLNEKQYLQPEKVYGTDFSLILRYNMNFDKVELAKSSIEEINRYYEVTKKDQSSYYKKLLLVFPDVKKGGEIEARYNKKGFVQLYYNKVLTGKISDEKFSKIFLDIWLHKDSKYPKAIKDLFKDE